MFALSQVRDRKMILDCLKEIDGAMQCTYIIDLSLYPLVFPVVTLP